MNKNQNIRFNMDKESDIKAWESLHSKDVGERFKSQNRFVIEAINYYYERVMRIQEDPYLETREKEDAFADRIVGKVERKVLSNLPALLGLYVKKQEKDELSYPPDICGEDEAGKAGCKGSIKKYVL